MKDKKIKVYFTMEEEKYKDFEKYTDKKFINKSKLIESLIIEYMKTIIEKHENTK